MSLVATVRALVLSGATPEMILAVVEVHEAEATAAIERRRSSDAARQAAKRERDAFVVSSRDITLPVNGHADSAPRVGECGAQVVDLTSSLRSEGYPLTHPSGASPKPKTTRSRKVPEVWAPTPAQHAKLIEEGFTAGEIERELAKFRDHEFRDPKSDWPGTFRNWLRRSRELQPRKAPHERPHHDAKLAAKQANYARAWEGSERAARFRGEP